MTCGAATAQTISGVVTDTSGGVLPGVTVEATNTATRQVRTATTDESEALRRICNLLLTLHLPSPLGT